MIRRAGEDDDDETTTTDRLEFSARSHGAQLLSEVVQRAEPIGSGCCCSTIGEHAAGRTTSSTHRPGGDLDALVGLATIATGTWIIVAR